MNTILIRHLGLLNHIIWFATIASSISKYKTYLSNCAVLFLSENLIFTLAFFGASLLSLIGLPLLFITRENPLSRTLLKLEASSNLSNEFNFTYFLLIIF